jgi:hypothetical protein
VTIIALNDCARICDMQVALRTNEESPDIGLRLSDAPLNEPVRLRRRTVREGSVLTVTSLNLPEATPPRVALETRP